MSLISRMRRQDAVYWAPGSNDRFGNPTNSQPVQIKCRWETIITQIVNSEGREVLSHSLVYVDRDVVVGGILWLGTLEQLTSQSEPFKNQGAAEIIRFDKTPNIRNTETLREAYL
jgi:hypothetical protein